jgi:hypothetical protein
VRAAKLDPFLVFYLANKRAQDALECVPVATQAVVDEGIIKVRELIQRATRGDVQGWPLSVSRPLATTEEATSSERQVDKRLRKKGNRRSEVALSYSFYRDIIVAYVLATTTVAFTSWAVSGYSVHSIPTLIVVSAFVSGVAGTAALYELRRP